MTYEADEESVYDGEPYELFDFAGPQISYRYTSDQVAKTYDSNSYTPLAGLKRSRLGANSTRDANAILVTMPSSTTVVADYGFGVPPRSLRLRIYRIQDRSGVALTIWDGAVIGLKPRGASAEIRSSSQLAENLGTNIPSVSIQPICNHVLYDERCVVTRASFDQAATVSSVSGYTVTVSTVGGNPDQWFRAGEIVRDTDGERRQIVDQVGAVLTISSSFRTLAGSDAVTLYAGCDHRNATCGDKFSNRANFGGHPSVPSSNPFLVPLRLTRGLS